MNDLLQKDFFKTYKKEAIISNQQIIQEFGYITCMETDNSFGRPARCLYVLNLTPLKLNSDQN